MIKTMKLLTTEDPDEAVQRCLELESGYTAHRQFMDVVIVHCTENKHYFGNSFSVGTAEWVMNEPYYISSVPGWGLFIPKDDIVSVEIYTISYEEGG